MHALKEAAKKSSTSGLTTKIRGGGSGKGRTNNEKDLF